jgi:hypothetical protein
MGLVNSVLKFFLQQRFTDIQKMMDNPVDYQMLTLHDLIRKAKDTEWGKKHGYRDNFSIKTFQSRVPVSTYEQLYPYIERMLKGEQNVLWHSKIEWFSKSSGTTNDRSKFIPVSYESLEDCHNKAGKDMLALFFNNFNSESKVFDGKTLSIGGTHGPNPYNPETRVGDVSAVVVENLPVWAEFARAPEKEIFMLTKWEDKIDKMVKSTANEDITSLSGVPTWMVVVLQKMIEHTGKKSIIEIWPNLEVFLHGAVSFVPYRELIDKLIGSEDFMYQELYTASEGFFAAQDRKGADDMLLLLDHGIFYEFMPLEELGKDFPKTLTIDQVDVNVSYAMVITTNAGLWRYLIGDTVKFTSKKPYRIKVTGRTKHFINAFGEEVVVENADHAITKACAYTNAVIKDYTAAPVYLQEGKQGGHEWLIEFEVPPVSLDDFTEMLDKTLREINSDYDAKRYKDIALCKPVIHQIPSGTFYNWLKAKNKLGGQNKVPRLSNSREFVDNILATFK